MESKTLLNTLSPQLQALVEASLGAKLPSSAASKPEYEPPKPQPTNTNTKSQSDISNRIVLDASHHAAKLNPSELFGACVETLVYGLKKVSPELDLRNVVSTQFAIFPGDGARFVKHVDTYSNAHSDERGGMSKDGLVRLVTCVYYLNDQWEPEHGGHLRVHLKASKLLPSCHWDVSPKLDTLMVFRSLDVEHEVMPTYRERKAVTIWYYGEPPEASPAIARSEALPVPRPLPQLQEQVSHAERDPFLSRSQATATRSAGTRVDNLLTQATFPGRVSIGICLQTDDDDDTVRTWRAIFSRRFVCMGGLSESCGPCGTCTSAECGRVRSSLQIDSHMRFRPGWDCFLINELEKCPSPKPILTHIHLATLCRMR
ncbi:Glycosyltransferase, GlcNAc [Phytophthora cactorum]|nr:Glycosyltransferase, GlcNAc [Phytophthora cactorum]